MQEVEPQVDVVPHWHLVGYESYYPLFLLPADIHNLAQCLCHGYRYCPHASTQFQEHLVHRLILEFVVYLTEKHLVLIVFEVQGY